MRVLALVLLLILHAGISYAESPQASRKVSGLVASAEGGTAGAAIEGIGGARAARGDWVRLVGLAGESPFDPLAPIAADGSFAFDGVAPGPYRLVVLPEISIPPVNIVVAERDIAGVALGVRRLRAAVHVTVEGGGLRPRIEMTFVDNREPPGNAFPVEASSDFGAELPVADYRVTISALPGGYALKSVTSGSTDLTTQPYRVSPDSAPPIEITLGVLSPPPWVRVRGRVEGGGPNAKTPTSVVLSGGTTADTLSAVVNADKSFEFPRVLPGRYEARTLPSTVNFSRSVVVGPTDLFSLAIAPPNSRDFAGEFVMIQPGEFAMGCSPGDTGCVANEMPAHRVAITRTYEIGKFEVKQAQWEAVMGGNPSQFKGPDLPVENVNRWEDAQEFLARLNAFNDGYHYRLPTEAEWEYAARAGTTGAFVGNPDDSGWYAGNSGRQTHPAGQKAPNAWGLYDVLGNVWEWVADWYDPGYYAVSPAVDPEGPVTGSIHVLRGGAAVLQPVEVRVSYRGNRPYPGSNSYIYGFRIVREPAR